MNSNPEFSDELLRRLPQKLQLRPPTHPLLCRTTVNLPYFLVLAFALYSFHSQGVPLFWITILLMVFALIPILFWKIFDTFIDPFVLSRGWYPCIEYIPLDRQLIINDLTGLQSIFRPDARTTMHLESLKSILVMENPEGEGWIIGLRTRKGDPIWIRSSLRNEKSEVCSLAESLSAIVGHPVETTEKSSTS